MACERDLEGIVGKWARGTYRTDGRATSWLKIKNRDYTQMRDRHELFASPPADWKRRAVRRPDLVLAKLAFTAFWGLNSFVSSLWMRGCLCCL